MHAQMKLNRKKIQSKQFIKKVAPIKEDPTETEISPQKPSKKKSTRRTYENYRSEENINLKLKSSSRTSIDNMLSAYDNSLNNNKEYGSTTDCISLSSEIDSSMNIDFSYSCNDIAIKLTNQYSEEEACNKIQKKWRCYINKKKYLFIIKKIKAMEVVKYLICDTIQNEDKNKFNEDKLIKLHEKLYYRQEKFIQRLRDSFIPNKREKKFAETYLRRLYKNVQEITFCI